MRLLIAELLVLPPSALAAMQIEQNPLAAMTITGLLVAALFKVLMDQQKVQSSIIIASKDAALVECKENDAAAIGRLQAQIDWLRGREVARDRQITDMQAQVVALLQGSTEKMTIALQASTTALQAMLESTAAHVHQATTEHTALLEVLRKVGSGALSPTEGAAELAAPHEPVT